MNPEDARRQLRRLQDDLLVAEAAQIAAGWRFLTIDGITIESDEDQALYEQVLAAFEEVARGRECRHVSTSSQLTLGIRGEDASQLITDLRARLDRLNPAAPSPGHRWDVRDGLR